MSHDVDITVHHFHANVLPPSPTELLDVARELVDAATRVSRWHSVEPPGPVASTSSSKSCYTWARVPPVIPWDDNKTQDLMDWDAPLEKIVASDLSTFIEFENTDFGGALAPNSRVRKRESGSRAQTHHVNNLDSRSKKRQRSCTPPAHISISTLIPFPHYYESPEPACPAPPEIARIPAYRIVRGILTTLPYARTAWIVPLRGSPPFDGASSAHLCSSKLSRPQLPSELSLPTCIHWTPLAVSQFWTFLLRQRSMNNFGPLAFAYTFGPRYSTDRKGKWRDNSGSDMQQPQRTDGTSTWEYIKIYHDGQYALKLRSLLDSFRWDDEELVPDAPRRNRVLKGARLVLMDERGEPMLLA